MQNENYKKHLLPPCSSKTNNNKYGRLIEYFLSISFIIIHLYDRCILYELLFYGNLYSFPTRLFQFWLVAGQSLSLQLRVQDRNQPCTRHHPTEGRTHMYIHTHTGTIYYFFIFLFFYITTLLHELFIIQTKSAYMLSVNTAQCKIVTSL